METLVCNSHVPKPPPLYRWELHPSSIAAGSAWDQMQAGFDRAFRNLGPAPCQGPDAEGSCFLIVCNVSHNVLITSWNAEGCPLPSFGWQGQRAQLMGI